MGSSFKRGLTALLICVMLLLSGFAGVLTSTDNVEAHEGHVAERQSEVVDVLNTKQFQYLHVYYETHRYWSCAWNGSFYQWTWVQHKHSFYYSNNVSTQITGWGYMYYNHVPLTCYPG